MEIQSIKQRFGIIGNSPKLNRAIDIARQVAATDLSVLITGESGTGKEIFPQIIHQLSHRKHNEYIAVNCGAIPEGTIDSELFGHEKGAFTGATDKRRGYFEVADKGTIFMDETGELPLSTQVRLLRILETGEFIKVGSSAPQKTNVRVIAATNVNIPQAIQDGKFREDLFYRLNTVPILIPSLRERPEDIHLLFRKFAHDFAEKYRMPSIQLERSAVQILENYRWPGNIRQLKNITEQISIIEQDRLISADKLQLYLPVYETSQKLPVYLGSEDARSYTSEREILYKILFDMKKDVNDLKKLVHEIIDKSNGAVNIPADKINLLEKLYQDIEAEDEMPRNNNNNGISVKQEMVEYKPQIQDTEVVNEESLSLGVKEKEMIVKALEKYNGKRKYAANELGISERTLYRKIKELEI